MQRHENTPLGDSIRDDLAGEFMSATERLLANRRNLSHDQWDELSDVAREHLRTAIDIAWDKDSGAFEENELLHRLNS